MRVSVGNFRNDPMFPRIERVVADLLAKGNVEKYVQLTNLYVIRVIDHGRLTRISDLRVAAVQTALASIIEQHDLSLQSANHVLRAIKGFSRWLRRDRRIRAPRR